MNKLTVIRDGKRTERSFSGTPLLEEVLSAGGFSLQRPCGGRGACGKCAVELSGAVSEPNAAEKRAGVRLACQARLLGDAQVVLPENRAMEQIEMRADDALRVLDPVPGRYGAAVDVGTTTIALRLYELKTGACVGASGMRNPQTAVAADVMGRIGAALEGQLEALRLQVQDAIAVLLEQACAQAGRPRSQVDALVITGNTTMLYLLTGRNPEALSHAPFEADCLFDAEADLLGCRAYLPPCMNAFVGADITCAVLFAGQCAREGVSLLCDVGTNGEIALWKDGVLHVSSTAAGPAFEGAGISCGCGSVRGAIDRVRLGADGVEADVIGGGEAVGVCGSGLIDAIAAFLSCGEIDETGATEADRLELRDGVALLPRDVRAVQLAKAAIAAGIETLLEAAGATVDEVETLYIAGGFGSHLNVESAARIGLFPAALTPRVQVLGNAALAGAARLLLDRGALRDVREIARRARHINLGGNSRFNEHYMDQMFFPE